MHDKKNYRTTDTTGLPGVYLFRDRFQKVIYVGKAKSLRKRLSNYFQPSRKNTADPKLRSLINSIEYYELFPVRQEEEALLLESRLIKQYRPRYNTVLRDDKRFLLIKIDINAPFPRVTLARLRKDDDYLYYGPFPQAGVLRDTVDFLQEYFGLRSCRPRIPGENERRHCLDHIIKYCSAPCVGSVDSSAYHSRINSLIEVVEGKTGDVVQVLEDRMQQYAAKQNYERAGKIRDIISNIRTIFNARNRTFSRGSAVRYPGPEAVLELEQVLALKRPPNTIECFDISNISGSFSVASMVRFKNGAPAKKDYRHYRIRDVSGIDDFAMMREVVHRRYSRLQRESRDLPDLVVVDGGKGQLSVAHAALCELKITELPIIGLAKKQEEIFTVGSDSPIVLERHRPALHLIQAIRDEAHRFANSFHQSLRQKRIQDSILDEIPGIGKVRKQELLKRFGSVRNLRRYGANEIVERIPGIGKKLADEIAAVLRGSKKN